MTVVDTSSWIQFLRRNGQPEVKQRVRGLLDRGESVICPVVLVELWMGAGSEPDRRDVADLQSVLISLPIDTEVWACASSLASVCRAKGTPMPSSDVIIAACAFTHGAALEAVDAHFATLEGYRSLIRGA